LENALLEQVAIAYRSIVREARTVARFGWCELCVVEGLSAVMRSASQAASVGEKILTSLASDLPLGWDF